MKGKEIEIITKEIFSSSVFTLLLYLLIYACVCVCVLDRICVCGGRTSTLCHDMRTCTKESQHRKVENHCSKSPPPPVNPDLISCNCKLPHPKQQRLRSSKITVIWQEKMRFCLQKQSWSLLQGHIWSHKRMVPCGNLFIIYLSWSNEIAAWSTCQARTRHWAQDRRGERLEKVSVTH